MVLRGSIGDARGNNFVSEDCCQQGLGLHTAAALSQEVLLVTAAMPCVEEEPLGPVSGLCRSGGSHVTCA
jgi:hypothetical protein